MKNKIFNLSKIIALCLISIISIYSCQNEEVNNKCETCETEDYVLSKVELNQQVFEFKKYINSNSSQFLFSTVNVKTDLHNFFTSKKLEALKIDLNEVVGMNIYSNNQNIKGTENYQIEDKNILGITFYLKKNNEIILKLYKNVKNKFVEQEISNTKIGSITSTQIIEISNLFFRTNIKSNFLFVDKNYNEISGLDNIVFGNKIKSLYKKNSIDYNSKVGGSGGCSSPCTGSGIECKLLNNGDWGCEKDRDCPEEDQEETLDDAARINYNLVQIKDDLYDFRDNYLNLNNGGQKIIDDYYYLGKTLNVNYHTLGKAVVTFDLLKHDIVPMINDLRNNPRSNSILINDVLKNKIINYLINIKPYFDDIDSINKIDNLINKTNFFANKTNLYITDNLHLY